MIKIFYMTTGIQMLAEEVVEQEGFSQSTSRKYWAYPMQIQVGLSGQTIAMSAAPVFIGLKHPEKLLVNPVDILFEDEADNTIAHQYSEAVKNIKAALSGIQITNQMPPAWMPKKA